MLRAEMLWGVLERPRLSQTPWVAQNGARLIICPHMVLHLATTYNILQGYAYYNQILQYLTISYNILRILWMEEILHHLGWLKS